jgi:hypothetical protein
VRFFKLFFNIGNLNFRDFGTRFGHCLSVTHVENLDLSNNALEDKGKFIALLDYMYYSVQFN